MIRVIKNLISPDLAKEIFKELDKSPDWKEGLTRSTEYKNKVKKNLELRKRDSTEAYKYLGLIEKTILKNKEFQTNALPYKLVTPRFNCCTNGGFYGKHADGAIMNNPPIRSDLSTTIFLTEPDSYEGGEIVIQNNNGEEFKYKGKPGDAILYPSYFVHEVKPVTKGKRISCIFWTQSMVREESKRALLARFYQLGSTLQSENGLTDTTTEAVSLYNNLLRLWVET